jgi:hypothetical protein
MNALDEERRPSLLCGRGRSSDLEMIEQDLRGIRHGPHRRLKYLGIMRCRPMETRDFPHVLQCRGPDIVLRNIHHHRRTQGLNASTHTFSIAHCRELTISTANRGLTSKTLPEAARRERIGLLLPPRREPPSGVKESQGRDPLGRTRVGIGSAEDHHHLFARFRLVSPGKEGCERRGRPVLH